VLDNTLILFLSDNGGNGEAGPKGRTEGKELGSKDSTVFIGMNWAGLNNTPFRRFKHFTHEGGVSTPLIAHWPAGIPKSLNGKLEHQPGHLIDVMATVVEISGAKYPDEFNGKAIIPMEGVSLRPAFNGKPLQRVEPIFFEHEGNRAIRFGKWKLVSKYMGGWELYDLEADRTELNSLTERHPEVVKDLSARWEAWAKRTHTDQWIGPRRNDWGEVPEAKSQN
jgi:arylsulfatase A-like enzyme